MEAQVVWKNGMAFESSQDGHSFMIDADPAVGGTDQGPRPKTLLLSGLAGCTAMDVISILRKMRVDVEAFKVHTEAELTDEHPKTFTRINITYTFQGSDLPREKLEKAVDLSLERYCGVTAMLAKSASISHQIVIESP